MFEGKVIDFIDEDGTKYKARVIACVKDIGVTLVNNEDPSEYLRCLIMKNAPNFWPGKGEITHTRKLFTIYRKGIIAGFFDTRELNASPGAGPDTCAFGQ